MAMRCVVPTCQHDSNRNYDRDIWFFRFPTDPWLRVVWLRSLRCSWLLDETSAVCSDHFLVEDLIFSAGQHGLRSGAVPVLNNDFNRDRLRAPCDVKVCRVCLATDCEMCQMVADDTLYEAYEAITGLVLAKEAKLPRYLCNACSRRLLACAVFRSSSLRAHSLLQQLLTEHGCITLESLQSLSESHISLSSDEAENQTDLNDVDIESAKKEGNVETEVEAETMHLPDVAGDGSDEIITVEDNDDDDDSVNYLPVYVSSLNEQPPHGLVKAGNYGLDQDGRNKDTSNDYIEHGAGIEGEDDSSDDSMPLRIALPTEIPEDNDDKNNEPPREQDDGPSIADNSSLDMRPYDNLNDSDGTSISYSCNMCSYVTFSKKSLACHFRAHSGEKSYSRDLYSADYAKYVHARSGEKTFSCVVCKEGFSDEGSFNRHMQVHSIDNPYSCYICNRSFVDSACLKRHFETHFIEKPYSCDRCTKRFSRQAYLTVHKRVHSGEKPYTCDMCSKTFSQSSNLRIHLRMHTGEKPYSCKTCNKRFTYCTTLRKHITLHSDEKYRCSYCDRTFQDEWHLKKHMCTHTGEKPYSCQSCNKAFRKASLLQKHMHIHTGEQPYECDVCNKKFTTKDSLRSHIGIHSTEKPFTCEVCQKKFRLKIGLQLHLKTHTGEYSCKICNVQFSKQSKLNRHMKIHKELMSER